jgi:predicted GH43/DUF377 family glycosyl hydrolase
MLNRFNQGLSTALGRLERLGGARAIVGIPFRDERDSILDVIQTARRGLSQMSMEGASAVIFAGPETAIGQLEESIRNRPDDIDIPVYGLPLGRDFEERGWCIRGILEATQKLKAPLALLVPDLAPQKNGEDRSGQGFSPGWIERLLAPVMQHGQELSLARFDRHPWAHPVESLFAFPFITEVFGLKLRQPTPTVCALSRKTIKLCLDAAVNWHHEAGMYGFYSWLTTRAVMTGDAICEVPLGVASFRHEFGKLKQEFRQVAHILFSQADRHSDWWLRRSVPIGSPRVFGFSLDQTPPPYQLEPRQLLRRFKLEFDHFDDTLFREILPESLRERIESLTEPGINEQLVTAREWIAILQEFLLAYGFESRFHRDDIVDGLFPFFLARLVTYVNEVKELERSLGSSRNLPQERAQTIVRNEAEFILHRQAELAAETWPKLRIRWAKRKSATIPYLPRLGSWEFVPRVGIVVPQELEKPDGGHVWANQVYKELIDRYRNEFLRFTHEQLGIGRVSDSSQILQRVWEFMGKLEHSLERIFPFDLYSLTGAEKMTGRMFGSFASGTSFQLMPKTASSILNRIPPRNLLTQLGKRGVPELLGDMAPNDALAMAAWFDRQHYLDRVLDVIEKDGQPEWFHLDELKPLVVSADLLNNYDETRGTTALTRLAGRVVMSNYDKGAGGTYPKLWFFLSLIKRVVGAELFSGAWQRFAEEEVDFHGRLVSSVRGHWGRKILSAHNAFENRHQRVLVERLLRFADILQAGNPGAAEDAKILRATADVYHLSITLPDATFVSLSAWTWASYSSRGGLGAPTPLSSLVERDWATRDFLATYLERAERGGHAAIDDAIYELMGQGRESEDLGHHLLKLSTDTERLVVLQAQPSHNQPAKKLARPVQGPILTPIPEHAWESKYVLNAAALRLDGTIYIIYRAFGEDRISRLGLAWTRDGVHIDGRLARPIFEPATPAESSGCEDPRTTIVGDQIYMLYTAYDAKIAQIAMASIPIQAFLKRRFDEFRRLGLGFPGLANKDAVLYPDKFDGKYVIYHRIDPNMWISYLNRLDCPWPRTEPRIVVGPRPGMMWDGVKIGAGAQPIKTTQGWLNIYHGVDYERSYRLGVMFMDLHDPAKLLYQSPNPILEPEQGFEIGNSTGDDFWVPRVVFTCGAVPAEDKEVVGPDDEILVYYGAADTSIGVAKSKLRDLVPVLDALRKPAPQ